jgi:hypothetical protein
LLDLSLDFLAGRWRWGLGFLAGRVHLVDQGQDGEGYRGQQQLLLRGLHVVSLLSCYVVRLQGLAIETRNDIDVNQNDIDVIFCDKRECAEKNLS